MPEDPEQRASVRSWMAIADDYFFPSIYRVRMSLQRGYAEDEMQEAKEKLEDALSRLEHQIEDREYLASASNSKGLCPVRFTYTVPTSKPPVL
jgi:glutathione S-transferase